MLYNINTLFELIALAWVTVLLVKFYVNLALYTGQPLRKPFSCEMCLGFWFGLLTGIIRYGASKEAIITATLTSITAALLNKYVNGNGI